MRKLEEELEPEGETGVTKVELFYRVVQSSCAARYKYLSSQLKTDTKEFLHFAASARLSSHLFLTYVAKIFAERR